jgi:hypothetical protein
VSGLERIVTAARVYAVGDLFKACTGKVCHFYVVRRVVRCDGEFVNELRELPAGAKTADPMIEYYDDLVKRGEQRKQASLAARRKFGGADGALSRSQFYKRLAAR